MEVDSHPFPLLSKRSRSPSPHPLERPTKRLYVSHSDIERPFGFEPSMVMDVSSRAGSRQPSEDWVRQANELRIDSPLFKGINDALAERGNRYPILDEDTMMDDDPTSAYQPETSQADPGPPIQSTSLLLLDEDPQHILSERLGITTAHDEPMFSAASTPLQMRDDAKPKPRLTMGPRADCEKCRLGVKGHWMHIS